MNESCIPVEELARVAALPDGHSERRHLDACERCQSRLHLLRDFETPSVSIDAREMESVNARLTATVAELVASGESGARPDAVTPTPVRRSRWSWPSSPVLRMAWATAAVLIVVGAVTVARLNRSGGEQMRGAPLQQPGAQGTFAAEAPREIDGGIELNWQALPGADRYQVVFFDASLREIARLAPTSAIRTVLRADALPKGLTRGSTVGWQVEALSGRDRLARTDARVLHVP